MIKRLVEYLTINAQIVELLQQGKLSLVGVSREEQDIVMEVFCNKQEMKPSPSYYWGI